jgi:hypothetical protein
MRCSLRVRCASAVRSAASTVAIEPRTNTRRFIVALAVRVEEFAAVAADVSASAPEGQGQSCGAAALKTPASSAAPHALLPWTGGTPRR